MNRWHWAFPVAVAVAGLLCCSAVLAQTDSLATAEDGRSAAGPRSLVRDAAYTRATFFQEDEQSSPFRDEAAPPPAPEEPAPLPEGESTEVIVTDEPPAPPLAEDAQEATPLGDYGGPDEYLHSPFEDEGCYDAPTCGRTCNTCSGRSCRSCARRSHRFTFGGWIDQGVTANAYHSADRFNGPVTFNDRDGEYQFNQVWAFAEKCVDTKGCGWDFGGRVDLLYGTDHRFTMARGLEVERDFSDKWNHERFYGLALPQAYADVAFNDWTVRMGHFFTILGYETVAAPENFFYSHAYTMQYGEPFTHTGLLASYALNDQITLSGGFDRGWDNWEDNNDKLSFLGGASWTSCDQDTSLTFAVSSGPYDNAGEWNRLMYSVVFTHQLTCRLLWVLQHDFGLDNNGGRTLRDNSVEDAQWYGINQYLIYNLSREWDFGVRVEWFADDDGTRVGGIGAPHGWTLGPDVGPDTPNNRIGWAGDFFEVSVGLNWKPRPRITARPECRWDWYRGPRDGSNHLPYDFGTRGYQFTFATDLIITF